MGFEDAVPLAEMRPDGVEIRDERIAVDVPVAPQVVVCDLVVEMNNGAIDSVVD